MSHKHEMHYSHRSGWLRASVLGANDGIVSTASLLLGVTAAGVGREDILVAGVAALVAGAMSMAAGEYVSVSSQSDSEGADLRREQKEILENNEYEHRELAAIYEKRGLQPGLAMEVANQLMAHDALSAHARDELGLSPAHAARPLQAAITSAITFATGASLPLLIALFSTGRNSAVAITTGSLLTLAALGTLAARAGGAPLLRGAVRVTLWGALAMTATMLIGSLFGAGI